MKYLSSVFCVVFAAVAANAAPLATEGFVTNRIAAAVAPLATTGDVARAIAAIPAPEPPDFSTNNLQLVDTIQATAPTPDLSPYATTGDVASATNALDTALRAEIANATPADYAAVSNAAMSAVQPAALDAAINGIAFPPETDPVTTPLVGRLSNEVAVLAALLGESARFIVTNYDSAALLGEASVEILNNGEWREIWREMTRWDWLTGEYLPTNFYTKAETEARFADRAWGFTDSHTGEWAPDGFTSISSPSILISGGMSYQRTLTTEGAVWVLTANGMTAQTVGDTNGTFRIEDSAGVVHFEIVKGNRREVGADADGVSVLTAYTPRALQIHYSVEAETHPSLMVSPTLRPAEWKAETADDCAVTVSWSGSSGDWTAVVQPKAATATLIFIAAVYLAESETYIRNAAPVSMQYIMLGGTKYELGTATIDGKTVLTLTLP